MDAVMAAYEKVGIRVVFALQYADRKGIETIPFWKDTFPQELHPLLSTAAEPERHLDLIGHFEATRLKAAPRPLVSWALGPSAPERCSSALMQRHLRIGYNRAARLLEVMEREGVVGPADGSRPREVYIGEIPDPSRP